MNREEASESIASKDDGVSQPDEVLPLADSTHETPETMVGVQYQGDEYGDESWIICKKDDLRTVKS